jgi:cell division protein ZipA
MTLQLALLLIGVFVVIIVALSALDRTRINRMFRSRGAGRPAAASEPSVLTPAHRAHDGLDIDPAPLLHADKRVLACDPAKAPPRLSDDDAFASELDVLQEVATMPLDLGGVGLQPRAPRPVVLAAPPADTIDFMLRLPGAGPVPRDLALGIYKQNEYLLDKPHRLYGLRCDSNDWSELQHDSSRATYDDVMLSVQLVDAAGPISESELNTFSQMGLKLADALHRPTKFSMTFEEAMERAKQLQQFCDVYDVIAGVDIVSAGDLPFRGRAIEKAALGLGMQLGALNIFHAKTEVSPGCKHQFSLANMYQPGSFDPHKWDSLMTQGLTLFMSVPCAYHPAAVFDKMVAAAKTLCQQLNGRLLDQARKPLGDKGIAVIRAQIEDIDRHMREFGIVPGSAMALRLFGTSVPPQPEPVPRHE